MRIFGVQRFGRILGGLVFLLCSLAATAQPLIIKQPIDLLGIPLGEKVQFSVEVLESGKVEYQWRLNGVNLPGQTQSALQWEKLTLAQCGTYTVAITDEKGSVNSDPARLVPEIRSVRPGDFFQERIDISEKNGLDTLQGELLTENREATKETGEPNHGGGKGGASVWFTWTAPKSGFVRFTSQGSGFDTLLAAYQGDSVERLKRFSKTAEDDDRGGFFTSLISFNVEEGMEYVIAVDGNNGATGDIILRWMFDGSGIRLPVIIGEPLSQVVGLKDQVNLNVDFEGGSAKWFRFGQPTENTGKSFVIDQIDENHVGRYFVEITDGEKNAVRTRIANLQINLTDDERPNTNSRAHDKFFLAEEGTREGEQDPKQVVAAAAGPSRGYTTTQIFSTVGSTKDPGEPNHAGVAGGASEWFVYLAPESGTLHVNTDGSGYDTVVAVYRGGGSGYGSLIPVASNNNSGVAGQDRVRFNATGGTSYFIAVDGVGGASGSVKLNVNLGSAPEITSGAQSRTVGVGTNATFTVSASGVPNVKYQWRFNGANLAGATNSSYTRNGATTAHSGQYSVVVSNSINTASITHLLTVLTPPSITTQPTNKTVAAGSGASFTVVAAGSGPLRYSWLFNGSLLAGQTNSTLSIASVGLADAGDYSVLVTNQVGSVLSATATLSLVAEAPAILSHPASQTVAPNATVTLSVSASGSPAPAYQWFFNNNVIPSATGASLVLSNFQDSYEGTYYAVATNASGSAKSNPARLALNSPLRTGSFTHTAGGPFELSIVGEAGATYVLECTTNLVEWIPIQTNSSPDGFVVLADTNAVGFVQRFYRISGD